MIDGLKERIAVLLSSNVRPAQVSRALNVSEGYISGLMGGDDEFKMRLGELVAERMEHEVVVEAGYDNVEKDALGAMKELIPNADMRELSLALEAVNKHQLRSGKGAGGQSGGSGGMSVTVQLPSHVTQAIRIEVSERNEIVEVAGKGMLSLTAAQFGDKLRERQAVGREANQLPSPTEEVNHVTDSNRPSQAASQRFAEIERIVGERHGGLENV